MIVEGGFGDDGLDGDILGGDEEGGGWDVGDEDLVLPPDLVSLCERFFFIAFYVNPGFNQFYKWSRGFRIDQTQSAFNLSLLPGT